jgi:Uma2 family endonuclease
MAEPARTELRYTTKQYFALVEQGVLDPDDRVELLEGVIVSMSPQSARHASAIRRVDLALRKTLGERALVDGQLPLLIGKYSAPEPEVMVLAGAVEDYDDAHPTTALLVVEVADSSLQQDRITKSAIYAAGGIREYWLVNLRDDCVEVSRGLDQKRRRYRQTFIARRGDAIELAAFPGAKVVVNELLPGVSRHPRAAK